MPNSMPSFQSYLPTPLCGISFGTTDNPLLYSFGSETIYYWISYPISSFNCIHLLRGSVFQIAILDHDTFTLLPQAISSTPVYLTTDFIKYDDLLSTIASTSLARPPQISHLKFPIVNTFTQYSLIHYVLNLLSISNPSSYSPKSTFFLYVPS